MLSQVQCYRPVIYLPTRTKVNTRQKTKQNLQSLHWIIHKVKDKIKINIYVKKQENVTQYQEREKSI